MKIIETDLPGVLIFEPKVFSDDRGFFMETFSLGRYTDAVDLPAFVQDNISFSCKGTLRGLHFQHPHGQGKLVQILCGEATDVAVDIRVGSASFGEHVAIVLSQDNHRQMYIPPGFAHGFCVTSETAIFSYKCTDYYSHADEGGIRYDDPDLGIDWSIDEPVLSAKDAGYANLKDISPETLPHFGSAQ